MPTGEKTASASCQSAFWARELSAPQRVPQGPWIRRLGGPKNVRTPRSAAGRRPVLEIIARASPVSRRIFRRPRPSRACLIARGTLFSMRSSTRTCDQKKRHRPMGFDRARALGRKPLLHRLRLRPDVCTRTSAVSPSFFFCCQHFTAPAAKRREGFRSWRETVQLAELKRSNLRN